MIHVCLRSAKKRVVRLQQLYACCWASEMATSVDMESVVLIQGNNSISVALSTADM